MKPHVDHLESMTLDSNVHLLAMTIYRQQKPACASDMLKERKEERKEKERLDCDGKIPKCPYSNQAHIIGPNG